MKRIILLICVGMIYLSVTNCTTTHTIVRNPPKYHKPTERHGPWHKPYVFKRNKKVIIQ